MWEYWGYFPQAVARGPLALIQLEQTDKKWIRVAVKESGPGGDEAILTSILRRD